MRAYIKVDRGIRMLNFITKMMAGYATSFHQNAGVQNPSLPLYRPEHDQAIKIIAADMYGNYNTAGLEQYFVTSVVPGVKNIKQTCDVLEKLYANGPIKLFISQMHGSPISMRFHTDVEINLKNYFSETPLWEQDLSCLDRFLDPQAIIILESCSTALEWMNPFEAGKYEIPMNMHKFIAAQVPGRTVFAPDVDVFMGTLQIQYEPIFTVSQKGLGFTRELIGSCGSLLSDKEEAQSCRAEKEAELLKKMNHVREGYLKGNMSLPVVPFKVISPTNAPDCERPLVYYSMQKYCDRAGVNPSKEAIEDCEDNFFCARTLTFLKDLELKRKLQKGEELDIFTRLHVLARS